MIHEQRFHWLLDNGHDIKQTGKRSVIFDDGKTQFLEWEFNYDIVKRISVLLDKACVANHILVPDADKQRVLLTKGRIKRANEFKSNLPCIYLSIHSNAAPTGKSGWSNTTGIEVWHHANNLVAQKMAMIFLKELVGMLGWKDRGLKDHLIKRLAVLTRTNMLALLTETGFFTNKQQAADLMKDEVRQAIAVAHVKAILKIEKGA